MSQPLLDLGNTAAWLQVYDEARIVVYQNPLSYTPLPAFEIPFLFDKRILAVKNSSVTAKSYWQNAGSLVQRLQLGAGGTASNLPIAEFSRRKLRFNRTELFIFPQYSEHYELVHVAPYWVEDMRLTIWQYVGQDSDTVEELLDTIKVDVARIEFKIDSLL